LQFVVVVLLGVLLDVLLGVPLASPTTENQKPETKIRQNACARGFIVPIHIVCA